MTTDYSDLTIVRATRAQVEKAIIYTHETWGEGDELAPYRAHFEALTVDASDSAWAGDRFACWALVPRSEPGTLDFLASSFTWRRDALVLPPGGSTRRGTAYAIAAVYTRPENRKKGYAKHMCRLLHYVFADSAHLPLFPEAWGAPPETRFADADFSVLFSGVGRDFYANCTIGTERPGWVAVPLVCRIWKVADAEVDLAGVEWVQRGGLAAVEEEMGRRIARDLPATGDASRTRVAVHPYATLQFLAQFSGNTRADTTNALFFPADAAGERPFVSYVTSLPEANKPSRLVVTHVSHTALARVPFAALLHVARVEGMAEVEVWGDAGWDAEGTPRLDPDAHVPCIATYGIDGAEWEFVEDYTWC
ncbi:hypothetical protein Q8F55_004922 [Vanrija albida]|uniref:N-acetyltransferase domain-containing protein n=1 Tax=Vanrija albida TaxID=181172 RepID=A0ABR3Q091_9TREE